MYEAGEVDYMVATDAIGMGLNMDVNHVAFSGLRKFDGRHTRMLSPVEVGQIAGRAGRHMNDGSFGTTAGHGPFPPELVEAVESHRFYPVRSIYWRSRDLDFGSPKRLLQSLGKKPGRMELARAREAEDQSALAALAREEDLVDRARDPSTVRLLWDVCQIPDFRKIMPDHHAAFLRQVFLHLTEDASRLPEDWVRAQIDRLNAISGDIDVLTGRLADIRTWTYISHRGDWLADSAYWQGRTGAIEDTLSDALHERLTLRFVDRRAASIDRKRGKGAQLLSAVTANGDVIVEGRSAGRMEGLDFIPLKGGDPERRAVLAAARRAAIEGIGARVQRLTAATDDSFSLTDNCQFHWEGVPIGRLAPGKSPFAPDIRIGHSELLDNGMKNKIRSRLSARLDAELRTTLNLLVKAREKPLKGPARGIVFRLLEHLGSLPTPLDPQDWKTLDKKDRAQLSALGIRMTPAAVYFPALQKSAPLRLRGLLWAAYTGRQASRPEDASIACTAGRLSAFDWACLGRRRIAGRAVRFDALDRLARMAHLGASQGTFIATPEMFESVGLEGTPFEQLMGALGYAAQKSNEGTTFRRKSRKRQKKVPRRRITTLTPDPNSPFAPLRDLANAK